MIKSGYRQYNRHAGFSFATFLQQFLLENYLELCQPSRVNLIQEMTLIFILLLCRHNIKIFSCSKFL
jgi:hypothetical protein